MDEEKELIVDSETLPKVDSETDPKVDSETLPKVESETAPMEDEPGIRSVDFKTTPTKIKLDFNEDEPEDLARITPSSRTHSTDWLDVDNTNRWFTEPAHLNLNGSRRADNMDTSAVEDYLKSIDKMDNIRHSIDTLRTDLNVSELRDDINRTRRKLKNDLELSRSARLLQEDIDRKRRVREDLELSRSYRLASELEDIRASTLRAELLSEAALRPSSATPYGDYISTLRLRSLRLEEERLLEIRRLQELERLRGPQPKWYELKTPQFHVEARKNNELIAAKKQWHDLRDYTESVWRSRDLSRSATHL